MADRPIIFSGPMVRALLAGTKTQTRRIATPRNCTFGSAPQDYWQHGDFTKAWPDPGFPDAAGRYTSGYLHVPCHEDGEREPVCERCGNMGWPGTTHRLWPVAEPGDRLWVREAFIGARGYDDDPPSRFGNKPIWYCADGAPDREKWWHLSDRLRPSIHMPRWASRITLTVTDVRLQRLHEIAEDDARAEGCWTEAAIGVTALRQQVPSLAVHPSMVFRQLWDDIHGPDAWAANHWVVVLTFTVARRNIDSREGLL